MSHALTYEWNGEVHTVSAKEVDAIERSGRSSFQEYASVPTVYETLGVAVLPLMAVRPGQTEPGRSSTATERVELLDEPQEVTNPGLIHWTYYSGSRHIGSVRACTRKPGMGYATGRFARMAEHSRICERCLLLFNEML
jgi:hypothetical protein